MNFLRPMRLEEKDSKFCLEKFFSAIVTYERLLVLNEVNDNNLTLNTSLNVIFSIDIIKLISILQTKTKQNLVEKLSISNNSGLSPPQGFKHSCEQVAQKNCLYPRPKKIIQTVIL